MQTPHPSQARTNYEADGLYLFPEPIIDAALIQRAIEGMDAVRSGEYDTGTAPRPSAWNPGDDPKKLCKIEMSQMANHAIMELVSQPSIGKLAAEFTGAEMVQVWWVQLPLQTSRGSIRNRTHEHRLASRPLLLATGVGRRQRAPNGVGRAQ